MALQYRYPGAKPFQTEERHIFFGRADDVEELYQLLRGDSLVVLHAKSGLGKSSLINAGLLPKIVENAEYGAFNIRFYAHTSGNKSTPLDTTKAILQSQSDLLDKIRPKNDNSLWYHLKSRQLAKDDHPGTLLIFDQFEELFTYSEEDFLAFAQELSEALYTTLPQRYRDKRKAAFEKNAHFLSAEELALLDEPLNLHVLMAIRSDRMSLMKKLKDYLPNILATDHELKALNRKQAEDAVLSPAYQKNDFLTPVFDFEDRAIDDLLNFLSEEGTQPIESFQLQILCEYVEQIVVQEQGKSLVEHTDIANPDQILENYYLNKIKGIRNKEDRLAARKLIEEGLIFEEEERRLTLYEGQIRKAFGISEELLAQLLNTHLIRSEPSMRGGYTYELSHDTLVAPVLKAKSKRLEQERKKAEAEAQKRREAELAELQRQAEIERKRAEEEKRLREQAEVAKKEAQEAKIIAETNAQKARQRYRLALMVSFLAIALAAFAYWQYNKATIAENNAEIRRIEAESNLQKFLAEQAAKKQEQLRRLRQEAETYMNAKEYFFALQKWEEAFQLDSTDTFIQQQIELSKKRLSNE